MATSRYLASAATIALLSGAAFAQDATIHYTTPILKSGQPVAGGAVVVEPVPVYTPVPVGTPAAAVETGAGVTVVPPATMPTAADASYSGDPQVQISQHDQSVSFVTGGTGLYEKQWFDSHAGEYNLKVEYADTTGHHLAGVDVGLTDSAGATKLSAVTDGPYLLVKAKPGDYTLNSSYNGQSQSKKVHLGGGTTRTSVTFRDLE